MLELNNVYFIGEPLRKNRCNTEKHTQF